MQVFLEKIGRVRVKKRERGGAGIWWSGIRSEKSCFGEV